MFQEEGMACAVSEGRDRAVGSLGEQEGRSDASETGEVKLDCIAEGRATARLESIFHTE